MASLERAAAVNSAACSGRVNMQRMRRRKRNDVRKRNVEGGTVTGNFVKSMV